MNSAQTLVLGPTSSTVNPRQFNLTHPCTDLAPLFKSLATCNLQENINCLPNTLLLRARSRAVLLVITSANYLRPPMWPFKDTTCTCVGSPCCQVASRQLPGSSSVYAHSAPTSRAISDTSFSRSTAAVTYLDAASHGKIPQALRLLINSTGFQRDVLASQILQLSHVRLSGADYLSPGWRRPQAVQRRCLPARLSWRGVTQRRWRPPPQRHPAAQNGGRSGWS